MHEHRRALKNNTTSISGILRGLKFYTFEYTQKGSLTIKTNPKTSPTTRDVLTDGDCSPSGGLGKKSNSSLVTRGLLRG